MGGGREGAGGWSHSKEADGGGRGLLPWMDGSRACTFRHPWDMSPDSDCYGPTEARPGGGWLRAADSGTERPAGMWHP